MRENKYFEKVWRRYPKKEGREQALYHFNLSVKNGIDLHNIYVSIGNYLSKIALEKIEMKDIYRGDYFFKNWKNYLNV